MKTTADRGSAVLALLGAALVTSTSSTSVSAADCVGGQSGARLAKGATASDPNSVTRAQLRAMDAATQRRLTSLGYRSSPRTLDPGSVTVPVRVHVITKTDGTGNVSNTRINDQIRVLNRAYSGVTFTAAANTPFSFEIASIYRT